LANGLLRQLLLRRLGHALLVTWLRRPCNGRRVMPP
jgi:hypothetical protein